MTWEIVTDHESSWELRDESNYANPDYYVSGYVAEETTTWVNQDDQVTTWL